MGVHRGVVAWGKGVRIRGVQKVELRFVPCTPGAAWAETLQQMLIAITRQVSSTLNDCGIIFHERQPIDIARAVEQHEKYQECLRELGVRVIPLPAEPELPDAVFVEDPAVVVDELAIIL